MTTRTAPAELAERTRSRLLGERSREKAQLHTRRLVIELPDRECPADLGEEIASFNSLAAEWTARDQALFDGIVGLPLQMREPEIKGSDLEAEAAHIRRDRYDLSQSKLDLLGSRARLLRQLAATLTTTQVPEAEAQVEAAMAKSEKLLRKAGRGPEDRVIWQQSREAAKIQFAQEVKQHPDVRTSTAALGVLRQAIDRYRGQANAANQDVPAAEAAVVAAFAALVGDLCC